MTNKRRFTRMLIRRFDITEIKKIEKYTASSLKEREPHQIAESIHEMRDPRPGPTRANMLKR
jgi:hypothetical protein